MISEVVKIIKKSRLTRDKNNQIFLYLIGEYTVLSGDKIKPQYIFLHFYDAFAEHVFATINKNHRVYFRGENLHVEKKQTNGVSYQFALITDVEYIERCSDDDSVAGISVQQFEGE
jgi:hypothetical protein